MITNDLINMTARQIWRMRRRYRGPLIGGFLGTAALIMIITLGHSVQKTVGSSLSLLGAASLIKMNVLPESQEYLADDTRYFGDHDLEEIRKIPGVITVAPSVYSYFPEVLDFVATSEGKEYPDVRIVGVGSSFFELTESLPLRIGRLINDADSAQRRYVCVIGRDVQLILFGKDGPALGKYINIQGLKFEIVGVLGDVDDESWSETVMVPIALARSRIKGLYCIKRLTVLPRDLDSVEYVHASILEWFNRKHPLWHRTVNYDAERVAAARNILKIFRLFAYVAIFATLILSGLGTATVMIVMVRERTPEIGLRRAVGATEWDIGEQFFFEAVAVNFVGCAGGIALGSLITVIVATFVIESSWSTYLYILAVTIAVVTGCFSGVISGLVPIKLAIRLDPAVAMRAE